MGDFPHRMTSAPPRGEVRPVKVRMLLMGWFGCDIHPSSRMWSVTLLHKSTWLEPAC